MDTVMANFLDERLPARFWSKVSPCPMTGCWLWFACMQGDGYGSIKVRGRMVLAHRFSYETLVTPIPVGLQLDHKCRVRSCCNPAHLEPVSTAENTRRGATGAVAAAHASVITHCPRGHAYAEHGTTRTITALGRQYTARDCRVCRRKLREDLRTRRINNPCCNCGWRPEAP